MNRLFALVGFASLLVLLLLAGMYFSQDYLQRETEQVRLETLRGRKVQFERILALAHADSPPWNPEFVQQLATALSADIEVLPAPAAPATVETGPGRRWTFDHAIADGAGQPAFVVRVRFAPPLVTRLAAVHQKVAAIALITALLFVFVFGLVVWGSRRALMEAGPAIARSDPLHPNDGRMLSHLAERSSRQGVELEHERTERQRAEADLHLKQMLLNRSLQEKIDMGRDLHDGLIQSLYAAGLTLQAAQKILANDPAGARTQIETSLTTINNAIKEVRGYISGLSPEKLRERTFAKSVQALVQTLGATRNAKFDLRIDDEAARRMNDSQLTDLLQIAREAISNSLRHGGATAITLRLHESEGRLCLLVQDNGRGFNPMVESGGHGLANIRARATRLDADLKCTSEPAGGTRLVLTLPAPPTKPV